MKTKLLYHENSFTYECTARVVAVEGDEVALDATVFYPGGGGQMADHGTVSWYNYQDQIEASVIEVRGNPIRVQEAIIIRRTARRLQNTNSWRVCTVGCQQEPC